MQLIDQQLSEWPLANANYTGLGTVQEKHFQFEGFEITAQFNPERIRSSAAKTDQSSISERPCFLCAANRPPEQRAVDFNRKYEILINPFPIFRKHLTIVGYQHVDQRIDGKLADLLELAEALPAFTIFYNGPQCGASAPDHFHFQAGAKGHMPVDREIDKLKANHGELTHSTDQTQVYAIGSSYLRHLILFESTNKEELSSVVEQVLALLPNNHSAEEPMMNILAQHTNNTYRVLLFPREKQRPCQYFLTDEKQLLMSPASVEMGGLAILPRKEDFEKITEEDLIDIYKQVSLNAEDFELLKKQISKKLKIQ